MLAHPSKHYIYYLLSERRLKTSEIVQELADCDLPAPRDRSEIKEMATQLRAYRAKLTPPPGFNPRDLVPTPKTQKFLGKWKIRGMWANDERVEAALDILVGNPPVKRFLEVTLLGPLQRRVIAARGQEFFGLGDAQLGTGVVRAYEHYFWNRSAATMQQWKDMIYEWLPGRNRDMLTALTAPHTQAGAALSLTAAGIDCSVKSVELFQTARDMLFRMFMEHTQQPPSLSRTQAACMAIQTVTHTEEQLRIHLGGDAELLSELEKMRTVYDEQKLTTVNELPVTPLSLPQGEIEAPEPEWKDQ